MKRLLLWTFDRGSFQWDIMCCLILAFLLIPPNLFEDVPEFMKVVADESIHTTRDKNGNTIFTARLDMPVFFDTNQTRAAAVEMLQESLGKPVRASRFQPVRDWTGRVIAYAIWKEK